MSGGSRFGPGRLDGERAEEAAALRLAGGVVAARGGVWDACAREEVPRGKPGGAGGLSGSILPRARGGRKPPVAYGGRRAKQSKPGGERWR